MKTREVVCAVMALLCAGCEFDVAAVDAGDPSMDAATFRDGRIVPQDGSAQDAGTQDAGNDAGLDGGRDNGEIDCDQIPMGGTTREVGVGRTYTTIGAAVAAAVEGDVVLVHAGTYAEQVTVNKAITIAPFGDGEVWVDGECATAHPNGIVIRAPNVRVRCFGVRNTVEASVLVSGSGAHDVTIEGMMLQDFQCMHDLPNGVQNQSGVAAYYSGANIRVVGNTIRRRVDIAGDARGMAVGIWFKSTTAMPSGGGHYIAYNTIEGGRDGIGGEVEDDDRGSFDRETIIEHNVIRECDDDGIQVEGGDVEIIVRENHISQCPTGIAIAPVRVGPLRIENNVIEDLEAGSVSPAGRCFKVGDGGAGTAYLRGNVCRTAVGDGIGQTNPGNNPLVVEGNVFQVGRYVYELIDGPAPTSSFQENCLNTTDTTRFLKWGNERYYTLASFQESTGYDELSQQTTDCSWLDE